MSIKTMIDNYQSSLQSIVYRVTKGGKNVESGLREIERLHCNFSDMLLAIDSFGGFNGNRVSGYISTINVQYFSAKKAIENCKNKRYDIVLHTDSGDKIIKRNLSLYDANTYFDGIDNTYIVESEV